MVNGYIRPLSVENHKTASAINSANGSNINNNSSSTSRVNEFKTPHSQSQFNLDANGKNKTKNFLSDKPMVKKFYDFVLLLV